ncbi:hypothetical protein PFISCL1PPCAC_3390, partial [Pristionchus fissidentatus]
DTETPETTCFGVHHTIRYEPKSSFGGESERVQMEVAKLTQLIDVRDRDASQLFALDYSLSHEGTDWRYTGSNLR